jgi:glycosyltransferase involved in cell wall biosynthesis
MEVAARELVPALLEQKARDVRITAFVNREAAADRESPWQDLLPTVTVPVRAGNRVQWVLGEQTALPYLAARAGVDLLHSLGSTAPLHGRQRRVVTIHDLIYARYPEAHEGIRDRGMRVLVPAGARRSDRVIAISQSTRADLVELLGLPEGRIDVVPHGRGVVRDGPVLAPAITRERFGLGDRTVLLSVSAKRPHKNLLALIDALAALASAERPLLVLPGYPTWHERELRDRAASLGVSDDVRFLGWLEDTELEGLWGVATAFVFPSLYEGFGLPVLEAMARGVPVACSDASSMPEVAGDAALLFDPHDERAIASAVRRLLGDKVLRERLAAAGLERAKQFTWRASARLTLASYARALGPSYAASTLRSED